VVNHPASVRNHPEKLFPLIYRQYMPDTLITADVSEIEHFHAQIGEMVIKPLYGYGGRSIFHIHKHDDNLKALLELMFTNSREPLMVQRFLPEVATKDVRIVMINGEVSGAFGRIPESGEIRANMRVGGKPATLTLSKRQQEVCEILKPKLRELGLVLVGLDMIGDYLTEINITSPTGLRALKNLYGTTPEKLFWDALSF
jgi:glutathione synthase